MRRFFLPSQALIGNRLVLAGPEAHHLAVVLRLAPGQTVELFDGTGAIHTALLQAVDRARVIAEITATRHEQQAVASPLTLAQCLLKGKKMDFLVQKATELGVHVFVPLESRYCENRGDREHQHERWQRIMLEACKQCHRATPMHILPVTPLARFDIAAYVHRLVAWEGERTAPVPAALAKRLGPICLVLGPEGGLHADELATLRQQQCATFSLGPQILRGETAALVATAIIQYLVGSLNPETVPTSGEDIP
ncbi:MAG: 16S rRNA (uracil(1498)-N(3))-methyltransferase [Desulfobulbus sp.]|jgi:16S rRNA (uracil1498-N3)-methyltransferase|uniref:RsmE family RNA methyltransferase n=1 Tax=Desulfobulbus sp. TaxID=895 RepID=UPI002844CC9C|nr:RsmE family RNA methyltransferase [Desulfobulbus sp.]MDR2551237.1 16S rRNA (uracil(1498)-N(3))-methyltransferase [Desulfobulbus sp.]